MIPRLVATIAIVLGVLVAALVAISRDDEPRRATVAAPRASDAAKTANPAGRVCRDAIERVYASLDEKSIGTLLETDKGDLIRLHHGWGTGIRNDLGLWKEDSPIRRSCAALGGSSDMHPDAASGDVKDGVWELVQSAHDAAEPRCCGEPGL